MSDVKVKKELSELTFEIICKHKGNASNLNDVFASYGCTTLEAKTPIIKQGEHEEIKTLDKELSLYATLAQKSKSAQDALEGRHPRTKNKVLKVEYLDGEEVLVTGETRERSPVDENKLDDEMEVYMKERARLKAAAAGFTLEPQAPEELVVEMASEPAVSTRPSSCEVMSPEELDEDLEAYMAAARRKTAQKRNLVEHSDRSAAMETMDALDSMEPDYYNSDSDDGGIKF